MAGIGRAIFFQLAILAVVLVGGGSIAAARQARSFTQADYLYLPPLSAAERGDMQRSIASSKFRSYPPSIGGLMQRAEYEWERCAVGMRGAGAMRAIAMQACNIWIRANAILGAHGWCVDESWYEVEENWFFCGEEPRSATSEAIYTGDMFTETEIRAAQRRR